jgi:glycosyltransferase involved in cell wall biosynthesis
MAELLSIVVPVYGCEQCLVPLHARLTKVLKGLPLDYEILLVNDGSPDRAWEAIGRRCAADRRVRGLDLSRNFGQHYAIAAGLQAARGSLVVVMDCDLQDDPAEIPRFYAKLKEGYDAVLGRRQVRQDSWPKRLSSRLYYRALGFLTDSSLDSSVSNFGLYRRPVIDAVNSMGDQVRFFPLMVQWVGFRTASLDVRHAGRAEGRSAYTWLKLFRLAAGVALTFSNKPLLILMNAGFMVSGVAACYACYVVVRALGGGIAVQGWSSVIISVWFLGGVQMIVAGIVGIYVGKIFDAAKNRPLFVVRETRNLAAKAVRRSA